MTITIEMNSYVDLDGAFTFDRALVAPEPPVAGDPSWQRVRLVTPGARLGQEFDDRSDLWLQVFAAKDLPPAILIEHPTAERGLFVRTRPGADGVMRYIQIALLRIAHGVPATADGAFSTKDWDLHAVARLSEAAHALGAIDQSESTLDPALRSIARDLERRVHALHDALAPANPNLPSRTRKGTPAPNAYDILQTRLALGIADGELDIGVLLAFEFLDAQQVLSREGSTHRALKHIIEGWAGHYVSADDVRVAAHLHPTIFGDYPTFNLPAKLVQPEASRLAAYAEARTMSYDDCHAYGAKET